MKRYRVEVTDAAMAAIHAQARYIAVEQAQPPNAQSWLGAVWNAIDALETFPRGHPIAEENDLWGTRCASCSRVANPSSSVDDERATVWVIALRR